MALDSVVLVRPQRAPVVPAEPQPGLIDAMRKMATGIVVSLIAMMAPVVGMTHTAVDNAPTPAKHALDKFE